MISKLEMIVGLLLHSVQFMLHKNKFSQALRSICLVRKFGLSSPTCVARKNGSSRPFQLKLSLGPVCLEYEYYWAKAQSV